MSKILAKILARLKTSPISQISLDFRPIRVRIQRAYIPKALGYALSSCAWGPGQGYLYRERAIPEGSYIQVPCLYPFITHFTIFRFLPLAFNLLLKSFYFPFSLHATVAGEVLVPELLMWTAKTCSSNLYHR